MERQTLCRACQAPIIFIKSVGGKSIPCDEKEVYYIQKAGGSQKIVTKNGEVLSAELTENMFKATGIGHISHFATCTNPDFFRKPRKSDRKRG